MQISNISAASSRYDFETANKKKPISSGFDEALSVAANSAATGTAAKVSSVDDGRPTSRERQDFSNMTPAGLLQAARGLYDAGKIDLGMRGVLWLHAHMAANAYGDGKMDFVAYFQGQMEVAAARGGKADPQSGYATYQRILDLMTQ